MKSLIMNDDTSIGTIKESIDSYIKSLNNYEEIKDNLDDSTITIIKELIAGYAVYTNHKNQMFKEETYLSTAKLESSVHNIAKTFGYYISRKTAPSLKVRYFDIPSVPLQAGTILGKYKYSSDIEYDVIYFGEDRIIEKLDDIDVYIGHYAEYETLVQLNDLGEFLFNLTPSLLSAVDDKSIQLFRNDSRVELTKHIEDYVVFNQAVDYSVNPTEAMFFITDRNNMYGLSVTNNIDVMKVKFLETDGYIDIDTNNLKLNDKFFFKAINHYGSDGEPIEKIRRLTPLFYSTIRRAVTEKDVGYVSEAHYLMHSCEAERDLGTPRLDRVEVPSPSNETFTIVIDHQVYEIITPIGATKADAIQLIYDKLMYNNGIKVTIIRDEEGLLDPYLLIQAVDSRDKLEFDYSDNLQIVVIDENKVPACCTVHLYYVMYNVVDDPVILTNQERNDFQLYLKELKLVGLRVVLVPALVDNRDFKVKMLLNNSNYLTEVQNKVVEILSQYELRLMTPFRYGEALVEIAKIEVMNGDEVINPVVSVIPNQEVFNIEASKYSYIKFRKVDIELVS